MRVMVSARVDGTDPNLPSMLYWTYLSLDFGIHSWIWAVTLWMLVGRGGSLLYLTLSELFLHGFALHPWAGYFLGVHRSDVSTARRDRKECQPTTSTYCPIASACSLNLTYHVEHHDFPQVPWSRLPAVRAAAPEFYEELNWSPGLITTIATWLRSGERWTYACHRPEAFELKDRVGPTAPVWSDVLVKIRDPDRKRRERMDRSTLNGESPPVAV
jgi:fatty acid desaturase